MGLSWRMELEEIPTEFHCRADYHFDHDMVDNEFSAVFRDKVSSIVHA